MLPGSNDPLSGPEGPRRSLIWLTAAFWLGMAGALTAQPCDVALVLTPSELYEQAAAPIRDLLARDGRRCELVRFAPARQDGAGTESAPEDHTESQPATPEDQSEAEKAAARLGELKPKVVVAVGTAATSLALKALPDTPVVFCMVPNFADRQFAQVPRELDRLAGVTTDIAPAEQIRWIKKLSPAVNTLGILHGERSRKTVEAIAKAGLPLNVTVQLIPARLDDFPAALTKLDTQNCDAALMVADSEVYNLASVQRLLLWGVRNRKPVWTFSPNVVKAGAFAAVYSEPEPMARQVCLLIKQLLEGKKPKDLGLQYPDRVLKAANERTAELIGMPLAKDILDALDARFGQKQ